MRHDVNAQHLAIHLLIGDLDAQVILVLGGIDIIVFSFRGAAPDLEVVVALVPRLALANLVDVHLSGDIDGSVDLDESREVTLAERLVEDGALSMLDVGT